MPDDIFLADNNFSDLRFNIGRRFPKVGNGQVTVLDCGRY
jgi:hypothetical protein